MNSKAFFILAMVLASSLFISAEVAPKDINDKSKNDDNLETNGQIDESKYVAGGSWGYGGPGPYRGGRGYRGWCRYGCCAPSYGYYGGCRRCCYYPGEHVDADTDVEPEH